MLGHPSSAPFDWKHVWGASSEVAVLSPVHGVVEDATRESVGIYIAVDDPHEIRAPFFGTISAIRSHEGLFDPPDPSAAGTFVAHPFKTERLFFDLETSWHGEKHELSFYVEVGRSEYVTDAVTLRVRGGDPVVAGQELGLILVGSRARIFRPVTPYRFEFETEPGLKLEGGKTRLGGISLDFAW